MKKMLSILSVVAVVAVSNLSAQFGTYPDEVTFSERNLAGPRLGITYVHGNSELVKSMKAHNMGQMVSQFGWQFEYQVIPTGGGPSFVVEFVPLLSGVEYSKLIPGASLALGVRMPGGIEFGLGPNMVVGADNKLTSALLMAVGKSFSYGGVNIPLNLVYTTNPEGGRISFVFGYAITKSGK